MGEKWYKRKTYWDPDLSRQRQRLLAEARRRLNRIFRIPIPKTKKDEEEIVYPYPYPSRVPTIWEQNELMKLLAEKRRLKKKRKKEEDEGKKWVEKHFELKLSTWPEQQKLMEEERKEREKSERISDELKKEEFKKQWYNQNFEYFKDYLADVATENNENYTKDLSKSKYWKKILQAYRRKFIDKERLEKLKQIYKRYYELYVKPK